MNRITRALVALITAGALAVAIPTAASADPSAGDGCTTSDNEVGLVVVFPSAVDGFGCDTGSYVNVTTWWSDHRDENGCNAWGTEPHGYCTGG